jgi:hypothetical protein
MCNNFFHFKLHRNNRQVNGRRRQQYLRRPTSYPDNEYIHGEINHNLQLPHVRFLMASVFMQRVRGDAGNALGDIAAMSNGNSAAIAASFADIECQRH